MSMVLDSILTTPTLHINTITNYKMGIYNTFIYTNYIFSLFLYMLFEPNTSKVFQM